MVCHNQYLLESFAWPEKRAALSNGPGVRQSFVAIEQSNTPSILQCNTITFDESML